MDAAATTVFDLVFQFPLTERTSCNANQVAPIAFLARLSVSSNGTNELQLLASPSSAGSLRAFSFL